MRSALTLLVVMLGTGFAGQLAAQTAPAPSEEIRAVQRELRALGYIDTPDSGLFDQVTRYQIWFLADESGLNKDEIFRRLDAPSVMSILKQRIEVLAGQSRKARVVVPRSHPKDSQIKVAISDDGKWGASFGDGLLKLWNMETGIAVHSLEFGCCTGAAQFLPGSKKLAIATSGPSIRVLDLETGLLGHRTVIEGKFEIDRKITHMSLRPGTSELVVGDETGHVALFDYEKATEVAILGRHPTASNMYSNDVAALSVSPDGRLAASLREDDKRILIWDLSQRKLVKTITRPGKESYGTYGLSFATEGTRLYLWQKYDKLLLEIDVQSGKSKPVPMSGTIYGLSPFAPASALAVVTDAQGAASLGKLELADGAFQSLMPIASTGFEIAGQPALGKLMTASQEGVVRAIDLNARDRYHSELRKISNTVTCGPSGKLVQYSSWQSSITIWDVATGALGALISTSGKEHGSDANILAVVCSSDGSTLYAGHSGGHITRWSLDGTSPKLVSTIPALPSEAYDKMLGLALSPDGSLIALSRGNGMIEPQGSPGTARKNRSELLIFNTGSGKLNTRIPFEKLTTEETWGQQTRVVALSSRYNQGQMAFSRDGLRLFAARNEWRFGLWDVDTGQRVQTYETLQPFQRFLPEIGVTTAEDRRVATHAARGLSRVSNLIASHATGKHYVTLAASDTGFAARKSFLLEFSTGSSQPDRLIEIEPTAGGLIDARGRRFVSANGFSEILVYDLAQGRLERRVTGLEGNVSSSDISQDGSRYYVGTHEGTLQVWDIDKGELLATGVVLEDGEWLIMTPEGFFNASPKAGSLLRIRTGPMQLTSIDQVYQYLYRPDLVAEKLAGDPKGLVKEAAGRLDLTKLIASGPAPIVRITSPAAGSADKDLVTVEAEAIEQDSGGIGRVEWRVNGVTLGVDAERGLARLDQTGQPVSAPQRSVKLTRTLTLEPGENTIEVVAYNAADLIASEPAQLKISLAATATITPPKLHVLAVGINDYYDGRLKLTYAVPDAKSVASALEKAGSGHYESVEVTTLLDTDVTVEKLDQTFAALSSKVRSKDVLVFFAAGHGKTVDGRYYYLPRDFRYQTEASIPEHGIGQEKWQAWFAGIPARKSILIYDTCESGTLTAAQGQQIAMRSGLEQAAALGRLIQATGRTVLTAATSDRPALEGYQGHGVFTYALLDGMGRADRDGNGLIEVTEIAGFIDGAVPEITQRAFGLRQTPQMSIQGSDFSLARRLDGLAAEQASGGAAPIEPEIPTKPSHVVFEAVKVFGSAGGSGEPVAELKPATTFAVVKTESGWALVARDGKAIGYIEEAKAQKLQ